MPRNARASPDADGALALAAERRRTRATGLRGVLPSRGLLWCAASAPVAASRAEVHAETHVAGHGALHMGCSTRAVTGGRGSFGGPSAWQPGRTRAWVRPIGFLPGAGDSCADVRTHRRA